MRGLIRPDSADRRSEGRTLWTPSGASPTLEEVVWTDLYRCEASGSQLTTTGNNATANSTRAIQSGDGYFVFACSGTYIFDVGLWFGVKPADGASDFDYRLRVRNAPYNTFQVYNEAGALLYNVAGAQGAGFRITIESGVVKFYTDITTLKYTSLIAPEYPLGVHAYCGYSGYVISSAQLYGVLG